MIRRCCRRLCRHEQLAGNPILLSSRAIFADTKGQAPSEAEGEGSAVLHTSKENCRFPAALASRNDGMFRFFSTLMRRCQPPLDWKIMKVRFRVAAIVLLLTAIACADAVRGTPIRTTSIYLSPDSSSAKLAEIDRGQEVVVLETSHDWIHVEAALTEEKTITGWIPDKGVVRASTPNGDKILFGEAVDSEDQASQRHGRHGAAQDAMRLYYRTAEYFPKSPLAGEATYRSADIRWQIEKGDVMSRPSAPSAENVPRVR